MAATVVQGRFTHEHDGGLVVFLIGMRVNQWWRVRAWWPTFAAMRPLVSELYADPSSGFLGHRTTVSWDGPLLVQYWRSLEDLTRFANDRERGHRPAWQAFYARARSAGRAVGIWHETFVVPAGGHESIYVGMPVVGLPKVTAHVPIARRGETARERLTATR